MKMLSETRFLPLLAGAFLLTSIPACGDDTSSGEESSTGDSDDDDSTSTTATTVPTTTTVTPTTGGTDTDPVTSTSTSDTSDTDPESSSSTDPTDASSSSSSGSPESSSSSTGTPGCIDITPSLEWQVETAGGGNGFYFSMGDLGVGGANAEEFRFESWFDGGVGTFDLTDMTNSDYATCAQCFRLYEDVGDTPQGQPYTSNPQYFQSEGSVTVDTDPATGSLSLTTTGVVLVEVTLDEMNGLASTPVPGGDCLNVPDATYATPPAPDDWTCETAFYFDMDCDCGCGAPDPACADATVDSCDFCNDAGSCSESAACPGLIDAVDNSICDPTIVSPDWTCADAEWNDGMVCDCGCGVVDPDCADALAATCDQCNNTGSCDEDGKGCANINMTDNSGCFDASCMDSINAGDLVVGDPVHNRTSGTPMACTAPNPGFFYQVHDFTSGGFGGVEASTCDDADFDTIIQVYQAADGSANPFNPAEPCTNLVARNDDGTGCGGFTSLAQVDGLVAGAYQVVVTSFNAATAGTYNLNMTCN